jgi:DNA-binding XRE family transcriptional regulator
MEAPDISERTRRQLDKLPPEKRAKALEALARTQTPEYRAREAAEREALDGEFRRTGRVATVPDPVSPAELERIRAALGCLRSVRESKGLSLADLAGKAGIDKAALSRLENGQQANPTIFTLVRVARALGKRVTLSLEDAPEPAGGTRP